MLKTFLSNVTCRGGRQQILHKQERSPTNTLQPGSPDNAARERAYSDCGFVLDCGLAGSPCHAAVLTTTSLNEPTFYLCFDPQNPPLGGKAGATENQSIDGATFANVTRQTLRSRCKTMCIPAYRVGGVKHLIHRYFELHTTARPASPARHALHPLFSATLG